MPLTGSAATSAASPDMMGPRSYDHYSQLTCLAPNALPGKTVTVTLGDMGMTRRRGGDAPISSHMMLRGTQATLPAGEVSFVALNMGWRVHELVVLPLSSGRTPGQHIPAANSKVHETGSLGEASVSCAAGTGIAIAAGSVTEPSQCAGLMAWGSLRRLDVKATIGLEVCRSPASTAQPAGSEAVSRHLGKWATPTVNISWPSSRIELVLPRSFGTTARSSRG